MSFPYKKLTEIKAGKKANLWNGTFKKTCYRYLWYELSHAGTGPYLIAGYTPIRVGRYTSLCTMNDKIFKCSLVTQLHILKTLPDTHGKPADHVIDLIFEKLRNIE